MSNLTLVTDNMLPVANETFIDNLSAGISAGAAVVPINSLAEYADGDSVVLTVDPGTASQATFIGKKQGNTVIDCKWTEGNVGASHAAGATVIDYDSATHYNVVTKLLRMFANENGSLKTTAVQAALNISSAVPADWTPLATAPSLTASNGQREFQLTYTGVDYTDRLQPGTKLRIPRTVTPTTQCTSLNGTNQYWVDTTPAGMTFTDDFVVSAWVKLSSYADGTIVSRYNGTNGWELLVLANGTLLLRGFNGGVGNISSVASYQSVPLNKWIHVTAQLDMSAFTATTTTSYLMLDGVDIPSIVARSGTNPTSLVQAGDLQVGARNGTLLFPGKIAHVAIYGAKVSQQTIRDTMNKKLAGTETSLVAYFPMDGDGNDLTANNNVLVGMNSATATSLDNPMNATEYAIVTKVEKPAADTLVTVFCPSGTGLPNQSLGVSSYSTARAPYGFPASKSQWTVETWGRIDTQQVTPVSNTWYNVGSIKLKIPVGEWVASYKVKGYVNRASGEGSVTTTISTGASTDSTNGEFQIHSAAMSQTDFNVTHSIRRPLGTIATATDYYLNLRTNSGVNGLYLTGSTTSAFITAECAYL